MFINCLKTVQKLFKNCFPRRGWIEQLVNSSTRVTLLLVQPDFADIILEAASEHNMIDSVYAWIASTAVTQSFVRYLHIYNHLLNLLRGILTFLGGPRKHNMKLLGRPLGRSTLIYTFITLYLF